MRGARLIAFVLWSAAAAAGCAKARAQTVPDGPPLSVPAVPERVIAPVEVEEPVAEATPPPAEPTAAAASPAAPAPRVVRPPARPEPPAASAEPLRPARPLTASEAVEERKVRDLLQRAARDIARVDYRRLGADARSQYDQSKGLAEQAEQAIKDRNWVFALTVADKAATLAAELAAR